MKKVFGAAVALFLSSGSVLAGGILTNTNQNIAFNRMMSREASIAIDGVYSNPAGVVFMGKGDYVSVNWQMPWQTRTIRSAYPLYAANATEPSADKTFRGHAYCPVIPSIQYVHNTDRWSLQANFAIGGAGGKCTFDDGLGSLERTVANTAAGLSQMAKKFDGLHQQLGFGPTALGQMFPNGRYSYDGYMDGQQFYWGLSLGAAYKVTANLSVFAGLRGVYGACTYTGHVSNMQVDGVSLAALVNPADPAAADISLDCDQTGTGFTPILGVDYKVGRWNFSARYEFKTRIRLKNDATNHVPTLDAAALSQTLLAKGGINPAFLAVPAGEGQTMATKMGQELGGFARQFSTAVEETLGEFADGKSIKADIPSLLTLGAGYEITPRLRANVGFHYFGDKNASLYDDREKKLRHGTIEYNAGIEYDVLPCLTVSTGWQNTNYGMTDDYMEDRSFSVDSNSWGVGACIHLTRRVDMNVAYFGSFYKHYDKAATDPMTSLDYTENYTRTNHVLGVGVNVRL